MKLFNFAKNKYLPMFKVQHSMEIQTVLIENYFKRKIQ